MRFVNSNLKGRIPGALFIAGCVVALSACPVTAGTVPGGIRLVGTTWNQALLAVPPNLTHAEFVAEGGSVGNVKLHMFQTGRVWIELDGKQYELLPEEGVFCAEWLNDFMADMTHRIDLQHPYLTETVKFSVLPNGQPIDFSDDATIAKAGPFKPLPINMKKLTVQVHTSPRQLTTVQPLSADMMK